MKNRHKKNESGWVLVSSLLVATVIASLTVSWARHAVLAKKTLEVASGASSAEEASRSGLERARQLMRGGDHPGDVESGTEDRVDGPLGEEIISERQVIDQKRREVRVRARNPSPHNDEEAQVRARAEVVPGGDVQADRRTRLDCDTGSALLAAGLLTIISSDTTFSDTEIAGLMLLESGVELTLDDVVLRGTIITRAGLCSDETPQVNESRPKVRMFGNVRLLAGTDLPDVAAIGPDLRIDADETSRVEVRGFVAADEVEFRGRGTLRGMVVSGSHEDISGSVQRPGYGRGVQDWPSSIEPGAERIVRVAFPTEAVTEAELDLMAAFDIADS